MNTKEIVSFELREQHRKKKSEYNVSGGRRRVLAPKLVFLKNIELFHLKKHHILIWINNFLK